MKQLTTPDGKTCYVFAERNDEDGGIITSVLVDNSDGTFYSYRGWTGRGIYLTDANSDPEVVAAEKDAAQGIAMQAFNALDDRSVADMAAKAVSRASGKTIKVATVDLSAAIVPVEPLDVRPLDGRP